MLTSKKRLHIVEEERDELRDKFEQLYSDCKEKETFFEVFLESFHHELSETIEQHEIVNSQHQELGDLINKIKGHFDNSTHNISVLTQNIQKDIETTLTSTNESTGLIRDGINLSKDTSTKMEFISSVIHQVETDVSQVIRKIENQKEDSKEVMSEIKNTTILFDEANELVTNHIEEASKVDNKLEEIRINATSTILSKTIDE